MKKTVKAATNDTNRATSLFEEKLEEILYPAGYDVKCQGQFPDITIDVACRSTDADLLPTIELAINEFEPDMFDVIPTLTFPSLTVSDDDYADSIHGRIQRWERIGKHMTELNKFEFNLESALETEDEH